MNSLKYLIKNDLLSEEERLMIKYFELTKDYRKKICSGCLGTDQQKCRNCSLLRGLANPTCMTMTKNIDNKIKKENKKLMQKIILFTAFVNAEIKD